MAAPDGEHPTRRDARRAGLRPVGPVDASALRTMTRKLVAADTHMAILEALAENCPDGLRASPALLAITDGEGSVHLAAQVGVPDSVDLETPIPIDAGVPLTEAMRARTPMWIESASERERWFPELACYDQNPNAGALLPLEVDDRVIGGLGLCFWYDHRFSERERQHYELLADICALAVDRLGRRETGAAAP